jgi:PAS domain S-box-containing protein
MFGRWKKWQQSLSVQLVLTLVGLVFLTATAIGIPALWIIQSQIERQTWALVAQGSQTTQLLISNKLSDLTNLSILTAQRPTLNRLVEQNDLDGLTLYLPVLREGAGLDVLLVCDSEQRVFVQTGDPLHDEVCPRPLINGFYLEETATTSKGWFLSAYPLSSDNTSHYVIVGNAIDDPYARQLHGESGMELILLFNGKYGSSSFQNGDQAWTENESTAFTRSPDSGTLTIHGIDYFAVRSAYNGGDLETVTALSLAEMTNIRRQLTWAFGAGILGVTLLSSGLGIARSRRITRPLRHLRDAAEEFRKGELTEPVSVDTDINELAILSYTLDDARIAINHTLTELRDEKAWREHILESVIEGIITIDKWNRISFFSRGAEDITGWKQDEVLGEFINHIFKLSEGDGSFSEYIPKPGGTQKVLVKFRDNRAATLAITGAKLVPPEAGKADYALVLRDVSNEEAIRRLLGDFLANISHEFRTPLSGLAASIELLLDQLADLEQFEIEELLNNIHLGTISLQNLIDNLLEGASIETGRFQVWTQSADAVEIVDEAIRMVQPLVDKYGLTIRKVWPAKLPEVQADPRRTIQVLVNLLSNAVKWGGEGSEITISIHAGVEEIKISVADRGPGIPLESQATLFHRFAQSQTGSRAEQGAGLGLSVVKAIIEAQGGQVGVRNRKERGAEFWFTLPLVKHNTDLGEEEN